MARRRRTLQSTSVDPESLAFRRGLLNRKSRRPIHGAHVALPSVVTTRAFSMSAGQAASTVTPGNTLRSCL